MTKYLLVFHGGGMPASEEEAAAVTDAWMKWFTNYSPTEPMGPQAYQTGLSMQVAIALENFRDVKNATLQGYWANEYSDAARNITR